MSGGARGVQVNGIEISSNEINGEVQYHPASNFFDARYEAIKALVIREMLLQRAIELGLCKNKQAVKNPDKIIDKLLEQEISVPNADVETCRRYYQKNKKRFYTSPLFEVSHILYLAPVEDKEARETARQKSEKVIQHLQENPEDFAKIAHKESACTSSSDEGRLGQISKGQTLPAFEAELFKLHKDMISSYPVETEVGFHIIKVHDRVEGEQLPFEAVKDWIKDYLNTKSWNQAFQQYIKLLAGRANIVGFKFHGETTTPLVQ